VSSDKVVRERVYRGGGDIDLRVREEVSLGIGTSDAVRGHRKVVGENRLLNIGLFFSYSDHTLLI